MNKKRIRIINYHLNKMKNQPRTWVLYFDTVDDFIYKHYLPFIYV
jgi:hypothetical protein